MGFNPTPRLSTTRGSQNEFIATKTYTNWRYSVTMRTDGAIVVKHGDWLSKYSAAIHNDFTRVHEFGRMDASGVLKPIHNVNLIFAGETIYHIPTYRKAHPMRMDAVEIKASPLSDDQRTKVIVDTLKADYHLEGERLEILENAAVAVHGADTAVEITEIAGWIAEGSAVAAGAPYLAVVSAFLTPIHIFISILNAWDTDKKLAGMQAIGYALTAWAFGDPIPRYPSSLRANVSSFPGKQAIPPLEQAWNESAAATVRNLEAEALNKRKSKKSYQDFWKAVGGNDRKELVRLLMEARAEELRGVEKMSFLALDPEGYPN